MSHATEIEVTCPYDKSHRILRSRLQTHLVKCSKNHELPDFALCPYDSTHLVHKDKLKDHTDRECEAALRFKKDLYVIDKSVDEPVVPAPFNPVALPDPEENWDDGVTGGYDPSVHGAKKATFRGLRVESASKRKDFRTQHRLEVQQRDSELPVQDSMQNLQINDDGNEESLRMPLEPPPFLIRMLGRGGRGLRVPDETSSSGESDSLLSIKQSSSIEQPGLSTHPARGARSNWIGRGRGLAAQPESVQCSNIPKPGTTGSGGRRGLGRGRPIM